MFAWPVALLAIVIERAGVLDMIPVLVTFGASLLLAIVAILFALVAFAVIWHTGARGLGHAVTAFLIGLILLAYPAYVGAKGYHLPPISDITTDPIDPPRFEAIARLRSRDANPAAYAGLYAAELQRSAYPDIEPLEAAMPAPAAYAAVRAVIVKRRWQIINERPPQPNRRDGLIEAVARTPVMGFRADVVVRIRSIRDGTRVDARSSSRYGRYDLGANAARLRTLIADIDDATTVDKTETPVRPAKPAAKPAQPARR